jgi:flagellin
MAGQNFSVINNLNSYSAQRNLGVSSMGVDSSLGKLSSGFRINTAADDAAGLAIGNALNADFTALTQGLRNANDGIGMMQIADGALSQYDGMLQRATELASQAASGTLSDSERDMLNVEYQEIIKEIDRVADTTNFKGENLLSKDGPVQKSVYVGDTQVQSQITASIGGPDGAGAAALGLSGTSIASQSDALSALSSVRDAVADVSKMRGAIGAQQNRMTNAIGVMQVQSQNILAAESTIMDTNMAEEFSNFMKNRILMESGMASVAQANVSNQMVLQLFR